MIGTSDSAGACFNQEIAEALLLVDSLANGYGLQALQAAGASALGDLFQAAEVIKRRLPHQSEETIRLCKAAGRAKEAK
jgi:hypothetical protein